jgi:hypothetical protein
MSANTLRQRFGVIARVAYLLRDFAQIFAWLWNERGKERPEFESDLGRGEREPTVFVG